MIQEVNYETVGKATEEQQKALKHAQNIGRLSEMAQMKRGYAGEITIPTAEKAKRRAKNKAARAARKRNR